MGTQTRHDEGNSSYLEEGSSQNILKLTLMGTSKEWIVATLLALSVVVNVALALAYRDDGTEQRLRQYEVQQLRVQADLNQELQKIILGKGCTP